MNMSRKLEYNKKGYIWKGHSDVFSCETCIWNQQTLKTDAFFISEVIKLQLGIGAVLQ